MSEKPYEKQKLEECDMYGRRILKIFQQNRLRRCEIDRIGSG
jgi:hypothetical protein